MPKGLIVQSATGPIISVSFLGYPGRSRPQATCQAVARPGSQAVAFPTDLKKFRLTKQGYSASPQRVA